MNEDNLNQKALSKQSLNARGEVLVYVILE